MQLRLDKIGVRKIKPSFKNALCGFLIVMLMPFFQLRAENEDQQYYISSVESQGSFPLSENGNAATIYINNQDYPGVIRALRNLKSDISLVTQAEPELVIDNKRPETKKIVLVGTLGKSPLIDELVKSKKLDVSNLAGKWETHITQVIDNPIPGVDQALVIVGSDKRGTIFGIYDLSKQIGVSPWYWWADVPVQHRDNLYVLPGTYTQGEPKVKYRGIFINDEAPALTGWSNVTFGGFNSHFYEKVFELILRLKGNFLWPAMWGSAFYDDDPLNGPLADEMGIVIGTTHHEPMGRAHDEWRRYGSGEWNYVNNKKELNSFWEEGFKRTLGFETFTTLGMRGDGDEPMSEENDIKLLENIIKNQRDIIKKVSKKNISETPQVWALYKEVQDYYDRGMDVPDDVTLLLCDDNWGNVRKLPSPDSKKRKGGYGMYYHFDYVGGPRNYKWINVSQIQRIWEQMNLTYEHGVDRLWIVNVGDIKPMEYPISFFLDMAWDPTKFKPNNLLDHTVKWSEEQFGEEFAEVSAHLINTYTKYNHRITPELLNDKTYSLENYNEFETVVNDYRALALDAFRVYQLLPEEKRDAFDQLVLFPINAFSNLYEMYFAVAKNKQLAERGSIQANYWADKVKECFDRDSVLTVHYNEKISGGKWNHMMDQVRIGYTYWQEPRRSVMPEVTRVLSDSQGLYVEGNGYVSIEAEHFNRSNGSDRIKGEGIPNLGKTLSGVTTFPSNAYPTSKEDVYLEYDFNMTSNGEFPVEVFVSPTLNFNNNAGLRYAISIDGNEEQIVNINEKFSNRQMEKWQADRINRTVTKHNFSTKDKHTLRIRVLEPGIVIQKIVINTGGLKDSYLGAPESKRQ